MKIKLLLGLTIASIFSSATMAADWTVGANVGNVPWEFQDAKGKIVGFEVDVLTEAARRAGKSIEFVNIPFNGLFSAVQSKRVDLAISSITVNPKRLESVGFLQPYYDSDQSLLVQVKSNIKSLNDMKGKVAGVDTGSTGDMWVAKHGAKYKITNVSRYEGLGPAMLDLASGRMDGYISDIPAVQYYIKDKPQFAVVERIPTGEKYAVMHAKNWPTAPQLNNILSEMKKDGFMANLHKKWYGVAPDPESSTVKVLDVPR